MGNTPNIKETAQELQSLLTIINVEGGISSECWITTDPDFCEPGIERAIEINYNTGASDFLIRKKGRVEDMGGFFDGIPSP